MFAVTEFSQATKPQRLTRLTFLSLCRPTHWVFLLLSCCSHPVSTYRYISIRWHPVSSSQTTDSAVHCKSAFC